MAPRDFHESRLGEDRRRRLAMVARFPRTEPDITVTPLDLPAEPVRARSVHGAFVELRVGAEACFADYDHPGGRLTSVTHVRVDGPVEVSGRRALRLDHLDFGEEADTRWVWRPHYAVSGDTALFCAKQFGDPGAELLLVTPDHPAWDEPEPEPESLRLEPGSVREPHGESPGFRVDAYLSEVRIGPRSFRCLRRVGGGGREAEDWADGPLATTATEEYFLADGRLLLWRRYNGAFWSRRNPANEGKEQRTFEALAKAGVPELTVFGESYRLFYDQLPDYAGS